MLELNKQMVQVGATALLHLPARTAAQAFELLRAAPLKLLPPSLYKK